MKKFSSALLLVLALCIICLAVYKHPKTPLPPFAKGALEEAPLQSKALEDADSQGKTPEDADSQKGSRDQMLIVGHGLGMAYLIFGVILSISCLKAPKQLHTDAEFEAQKEELANAQSKLEEGNKLLEELKASVEANKTDLEKLSAENKLAIEAKDAEIAKKTAETEALASRADNLEKDNKGVKREVDKLNSQINGAEKEKEEFKAQIIELRKALEATEEELKSVQANSKGGKEAIPPAAYQILYLLQKEGRLIDILNEDVSEVEDEALGGAIRPVLEGCAKLLKDRLIVEPILKDEEGTVVTVDEADPESIKLSGSVPASGPYKGELIHHGWRLKECNLPELVDGWKGNVIAPAEIEIV